MSRAILTLERRIKTLEKRIDEVERRFGCEIDRLEARLARLPQVAQARRELNRYPKIKPPCRPPIMVEAGVGKDPKTSKRYKRQKAEGKTNA